MTVRAIVRVPGDKSISHRALLCAALSPGMSHIRGISTSADIRSTANVLRALGIDVPDFATGELVMHGKALGGLRAPLAPLDCGNSGTTARLVAGMVAAHPFTARFIGDASLSRRPMQRIARPLEQMGARVTFDGTDGLPMTVAGGPLTAIQWTNDPVSAQVKSALLFAALVAGVGIEVLERHRSRDHTERMLTALGVAVNVNVDGVVLPDAGATGRELAPFHGVIPGDPSSAAFFAALCALSPGADVSLDDVCVNHTRLGFYRVLERMGAEVRTDDLEERTGEPVGNIAVRGHELTGVRVEASEVPDLIDELPLLAVVASRAAGVTVITGAGELRAKESDRIAAVVSNLRALGGEADELPDGMRITGSSARLRGRVNARGDHRIAMAFGILGALPGNEVVVDDPDCVQVSFPGFWEALEQVVPVLS